MKKLVFVLIASALFACAPEPRQRVMVDGNSMVVGRENLDRLWVALPDPATAPLIEMNLSAVHVRNIKAIELASGCRVNRDSIAHPFKSATTAEVEC